MQDKQATGATDPSVRQAMREHAHLVGRIRRREPASGNQLWRLNALGLLLVIAESKAKEAQKNQPSANVQNGEVSDALYITQEEASNWLSLAKEDGLW